MTENDAATAELPPATLQAPSEPGPANPSPDGNTLAYLQRDDSGKVLLWLQPIGEGAPRAVPLPFRPIPDQDGPQWSPGGDRLAVVGEHPVGGRSAIWLVATDGDAATLLVDHQASDRAPRWSPEGDRVAFVAARDAGSAICLVPAAGGTVVALTDGTHHDEEPDWSHDGVYIAFTRRCPGSLDDTEIYAVEVANGAVTQLTSAPPAVRHSPRFSPERPVIAYVNGGTEWDAIAAVNAENKAAWIIADEPSDKADPTWDAGGTRLVYTRTDGLYTRCCVRGTSWATSETVDPGNGWARYPRWLPDGRVIYAFAAPTNPARFVVQTPDANAERTEFQTALGWDAGQTPLIEPFAFAFDAGPGNRLPAFLYRRSEAAGPAPGVVLLDEGLPSQRAAFDAGAQALAAVGLAVLVPILHGSTGQGTNIAHTLRNAADTELEVADLADAAAALAGLTDVAYDKIAVVGQGYGGTLALLAAGGRPGLFQAAVVIDPVTDWDIEFDDAGADWRAWLLRQYGLPAANRGRYALRTPATYAALLDIPLLLLRTESAPPARAAQLDRLAATLRDVGVRFELETVGGNPVLAPFERAASFLREVFGPVAAPPAPEQAEEPEPAPEAVPEAAAAAPTAAQPEAEIAAAPEAQPEPAPEPEPAPVPAAESQAAPEPAPEPVAPERPKPAPTPFVPERPESI